MKKLVMFCIALFSICGVATCKNTFVNSLENGVYSDHSLGFRYQFPNGMQDRTSQGREQIQRNAAARQTNNTLELLLAMSSGQADTSEGWRALTIETYPRRAWPNLDDFTAAARMDSVVAGSLASPTGQPRKLIYSKQEFAVTGYGQKEGTIRKHAIICTVVRKDKLLAFAFSANTIEDVQAMAQSMKTLEFVDVTR